VRSVVQWVKYVVDQTLSSYAAANSCWLYYGRLAACGLAKTTTAIMAIDDNGDNDNDYNVMTHNNRIVVISSVTTWTVLRANVEFYVRKRSEK